MSVPVRLFGRLPAPDERDRQFTIRAFVAAEPVPNITKYYNIGPILDQSRVYCDSPAMHRYCREHGFCVDMAVNQHIASGPRRMLAPGGLKVYHGAQRIDEWEGEEYAGTSVRAGVKMGVTLGFYQEYRWGYSAEDAKDWIQLGYGPVIVGTNWHEGMMTPDKRGFVYTSGSVVGGHAYVLAGFDVFRNAFRVVNSWGREWGQSGRAWVGYDAMDRLIQQNGECCSPVKR